MLVATAVDRQARSGGFPYLLRDFAPEGVIFVSIGARGGAGAHIMSRFLQRWGAACH
jgi:hypothetical protein